MILLLGATGYIGQAFASELRRRGRAFIPLTRRAIDYTQFEVLFDYVRRAKPKFVINAAGHTGSPNVDACEVARAETINGNSLLPQTVARVCYMTNTAWGHVSSGSIYSGAKVAVNGALRVEPDLDQPRLRQLFAEHPERFYGFSEFDEPNFSFRQPPCNFFSGTKALAEEVLRDFGQSYIWRLRMPFDEFDDPRNFLSKLQRYPRIFDHVNSLSHLGDFVRACLDLLERYAPYGIYNVVNPGAVTTRQIVRMIQRILKPSRSFEFGTEEEEMDQLRDKAPRSRCILDASKLLNAGVKMRGVNQALEDSLARWQPAPQVIRLFGDLTETLAAAEFGPAQEPQVAVLPGAGARRV